MSLVKGLAVFLVAYGVLVGIAIGALSFVASVIAEVI